MSSPGPRLHGPSALGSGLFLVALLAACDDPPSDGQTKDSGSPTDTLTHDSATTPPPPTPTGETGATTPVDRFAAVAEALQAELPYNLASGVSVAVWESGAVTWQAGFGATIPGGEIPPGPDTVFQIGSTTKQMTAALALQQVDQGLLSLDAPLSTALPAYALSSDPSWVDDATLHLLLSHQGGLVDALDWAGSPDDGELASWQYGVYSQQFWANNPPGAFWNYSNPNFMLAGLATEEHDPAGRMWPDILVEDLFAPLGMTRSYIRKDAVVAAGDFSLSYGIDASTYGMHPIAMFDVPDPGSARPAGLAWSTPTDMTRWGAFLMHGDPAVLSDDARAQITSPQVDTLFYDGHMAYGYGEFVWDLYPLSDGFYPIRVWEHGGNTLSFTSVLVMLPDQDACFSILSNGYGDQWVATTEALVRALVDPLPAVSDYVPTVDPAQLARHLGTYHDPYNVGDMVVTEGGAYGLQIAMPDLTVLGYGVEPDLVPLTSDVWYVAINGYYYDLTFVADPAGGPDQWLRDRVFVGERVPDPPSARVAGPTRDQVERALLAARSALPVRLPPVR